MNSRPRALWPWFCVIIVLLIGFLVVMLAGCISTGFDFETTTDLEAGKTIRGVDDKGKPTVTVIAPRQATTKRRGNYLNNQALGSVAGGMMQDFGGVSGILAAIPSGGLYAGGIGILGLLGIAHKNAVAAAQAKGADSGYSQAQIELGATVAPAPPAGAKT